jgi:hypothetical protein
LQLGGLVEAVISAGGDPSTPYRIEVAMADRRTMSSPAAQTMTGTTQTCPRVADLIDYALGQLGGEERRQIEEHLNHEDCSACRGWVEKASRFGPEPMPNGSMTPVPAAAARALPSVSDPTPIPPSAKFQRQALADLEERLRALGG